MKKTKKTKISLLMPVLNEGINLKVMLKILRATIELPHETLVVYDTLDDDSIPVVKAMQKHYPELRSVHNKLGRGVVNAVKAGVNAARGEYVLVISADDIGPVLAVEDMAGFMDRGCDIVSATRYAYGGRVFGGARIGRHLSRISNWLFHFLSGSSFTDSTVGIKMFRPSVFKKIDLKAKAGWSFGFELAIKAQLQGFRLGEVPIISINRFYGGKSSFRFGPWVSEYTKWFAWGAWNLLKKGKRNQPIRIKIPKKINAKRKK